MTGLYLSDSIYGHYQTSKYGKTDDRRIHSKSKSGAWG